MNTRKTIFPCITTLILFSCSDIRNNKGEFAASSVKVKEPLIESQTTFSKDNKPNRPLGREDSLKVLTYEQLQSYMPQISGYKKGLTGGETLSNATSGGRQSYARQEYDNNRGKLIVEIVDYSLAQQTLKDLMTMYEKNAAVENASVKVQKEKVKEADVTAFSEINKNDSYSSMKLNIAGKYLININGNNSTNISFLKKIAESIEVKKLKEQKDGSG